MQVIVPPPLHYKSRSQVYTIYPLGDLHLGPRACWEKRLKEDVKKIEADPYGIVYGMGDYFDSITHLDKRYNPSDVCEWMHQLDDKGERVPFIDLQVERGVEILAPIADKIQILLEGNHESKIRREGTTGPVRRLANELSKVAGREIPYTGKAAFVRQRFQRGTGTVFTLLSCLHHGYFAGRKKGSKVNNMDDALNRFRCDMFICAHAHERLAFPGTQIGVSEGNKIKEYRRYAVMTGSYLRTYPDGASSYGEDFGFPPTDIGYVPITIAPDKGTVTVTI